MVRVVRKLSLLSMWLEIRLLSQAYEKNPFRREEHTLCALQIIRRKLAIDKQRWKLPINIIIMKNKVHEFKDFFWQKDFFFIVQEFVKYKLLSYISLWKGLFAIDPLVYKLNKSNFNKFIIMNLINSPRTLLFNYAYIFELIRMEYCS